MTDRIRCGELTPGDKLFVYPTDHVPLRHKSLPRTGIRLLFRNSDDGSAVAAADLPGSPGEEQGVATGLGDEAEVVGRGSGVAGDVPSPAV